MLEVTDEVLEDVLLGDGGFMITVMNGVGEEFSAIFRSRLWADQRSELREIDRLAYLACLAC